MKNEMRLIDVYSLYKKIGELYTTVHYTGDTGDPIIDCRLDITSYLKGYERGIMAAAAIVRSANVIDTAYVVRCKDCKYYRKREWLDIETKHMCKRWIEWLPTDENDFCSRGERKDDATD